MLGIENSIEEFSHRSSTEPLLASIMLYAHLQEMRACGWNNAMSRLIQVQQENALHNQPFAVLIACRAILNIFTNVPHGGLQIGWLEQHTWPDHVLEIGLSPRLLLYIGRSTELSITASNPDDYMALVKCIRTTTQFVTNATGAAEQSVAEDISYSYKLAAELVTYYRLFG